MRAVIARSGSAAIGIRAVRDDLTMVRAVVLVGCGAALALLEKAVAGVEAGVAHADDLTLACVRVGVGKWGG